MQYVLPAQVAVACKPKAGTRFLMGVTVDGFRSGLQWHGERVNMNHTALRAFANVRSKVSKHVQLRADVGWMLSQRVRFTQSDVKPLNYPVAAAFTVGIGVNVFFGRSVMDRILDEVLN